VTHLVVRGRSRYDYVGVPGVSEADLVRVRLSEAVEDHAKREPGDEHLLLIL
jgi:hypothetical protein